MTLLNLIDCTSLATVPSKIKMESLQVLNLSGCSKLKKFPAFEGKMGCLSKLFLRGTAIKELPFSLDLLTGLYWLNLKDCTNLACLPSTINGLRSLQILDLSGCSKLENVPETLGEAKNLEVLFLNGTAIRQPVSSIFHIKSLDVLSFRGCKGPPSELWYSRFPFTLIPRSSDPTAFRLPSFSGFCSLTKLDLSDCTLLEDSIPNDFGSLFSVEELDLSKNNFVSLPTSISRLSKLRYLNLGSCKRLRYLPELPSNIKKIIMDYCSSLETISDALKSCNSSRVEISCLNCFKLLDSSTMVLSLMTHYNQGKSDTKDLFSIIVPGSEIPEWFSHQSEGSFVEIKKHPELYHGYGLVGFAMCAISNKHPPIISHSLQRPADCLWHQFDEIYCFPTYNIHLKEKYDHLWLLYLPSCIKHSVERHIVLGNLVFFFSDSEFGVRRCGVHPIYEQKLKGFNQTLNLCSGFIQVLDQCNVFNQTLNQRRRLDVSWNQYSGFNPTLDPFGNFSTWEAGILPSDKLRPPWYVEAQSSEIAFSDGEPHLKRVKKSKFA